MHKNPCTKTKPKNFPLLVLCHSCNEIKEYHNDQNHQKAMGKCTMKTFRVGEFSECCIGYHQVIEIRKDVTQHCTKQQPFPLWQPLARGDAHHSMDSILW